MSRPKGSKNKIINKTCKNGHDITIVGRTVSNNCKQCLRDYQKVRRDFIREHFPKSM